MATKLPNPYVPKPDGALDAPGVQRNFDALANRFPLAVSTDNFRQVPQARVTHSAAQAIANATATFLAFDTERWDLGTPNNDMHDTATNNGRLTCRVAGLYSIAASVQWPFDADGMRQVALRLNGTTFVGIDNAMAVTTTDVTVQTAATEYRLAVGDFVDVRVFQRSGASLSVPASADTANWSPEFMMHWISP